MEEIDKYNKPRPSKRGAFLGGIKNESNNIYILQKYSIS